MIEWMNANLDIVLIFLGFLFGFACGYSVKK